jgi:hypothetical protein
MAKFPLDPKEIADYASKSAAVGAVRDSAELTRITADYADESAWANETHQRHQSAARVRAQLLDSAESIRASITKIGEEIEKNQKAKGKG